MRKSIGGLIFSRLVGTISGYLPVGAEAATASGQKFRILPDPEHPLWDRETRGYRFAPGNMAADILSEAIKPGISGNVSEQEICFMTKPTPGFDAVTNLRPFIGGEN